MPLRRHCLALLCLIGTACSESPTSETATAEPAAPEETAQPLATHRVLDITQGESAGKLNANILLSRKVDEAQLQALGLHLKDSLGSNPRSYLFFYLAGMKVGSGAWATAQFAPDAEIRILGATQAEEDSSRSKLRGAGRLIGKWYEEQRSASALAFYEQDGQYLLRRVYKGGTPVVTRFVRTDNTFKPKKETGLGEYFVLQADGTLGFVNEEGTVFGRALPIQ